MSKKRYVTAIVISLVLSVCLFGRLVTANDTYKVTVVVHGGTTDPFWQIQERGIQDIQAQIPDIEVSYRGPKVYDMEEFMDILREAVQEKPDALVCTLTYPLLMDEVLRPAIAEGLPVIAINADDMRSEDERIPVLTYIGEDSYQIGVIAAEETLKRFTPKQALFANHHLGADNIDARGRGWVDTMQQNGILAEQIDITADDPVRGSQMIAAYLIRHPDTDAIFMSNIPRARTTIAQLEADGYQVGQDIKFAQMDVDPTLLDYLKSDTIMFTIDQQPYLQAYLGVMFAYLYVKYEIVPPPPPLLTGPGIVTKDTIDEFLELAEKGIR
ncbi:hypothetical protein CSA56_13570 [candidate division KSB3 bacterium]|uniref:Periplasmic binding protein domain-containing protein n=1 Tax=candidate division KSB3 bacterium TaxID=2044937 RepID=A0A2G6KB70_9BACT|nr:MAG: hypothetical protein CSA56_13570 [candidate division KSB3 bacterium]